MQTVRKYKKTEVGLYLVVQLNGHRPINNVTTSSIYCIKVRINPYINYFSLKVCNIFFYCAI